MKMEFAKCFSVKAILLKNGDMHCFVQIAVVKYCFAETGFWQMAF